MDDFLQSQIRRMQQVRTDPIQGRREICFEDEQARSPASLRRGSLWNLQTLSEMRNEGRGGPADLSSEAASFRQGAESIPVLGHEFEAELHLFLDFRVVWRQQVALRGFRPKQDVVLLQLQSIKKLLGEDDAGGGANGAKFEFHGISSITINIIIYSKALIYLVLRALGRLRFFRLSLAYMGFSPFQRVCRGLSSGSAPLALHTASSSC